MKNLEKLLLKTEILKFRTQRKSFKGKPKDDEPNDWDLANNPGVVLSSELLAAMNEVGYKVETSARVILPNKEVKEFFQTVTAENWEGRENFGTYFGLNCLKDFESGTVCLKSEALFDISHACFPNPQGRRCARISRRLRRV